MSFLSEVLSSAEETNLHTVKKKLPILSTQIVLNKQEVCTGIDDVYYKFSDWPKRNQTLLDESLVLSHEINSLERKIEEVTIKDIEKNNTKINNLCEELDRSNITLLYITHIIQIHEGLASVQNLCHDGLYIEAARAFINLEKLVNNIPSEEVTETMLTLKDNVHTEKDKILSVLYKMFRDIVQVHSHVSNNIQTNTIKVTEKAELVTELFEVLHLFNAYTETFDRITKFILGVCKGVIQYVATTTRQDESSYYVLVIAIKKTIVKSHHTEVFSKLTEIFSFLYAHFDYAIDIDLTTMRYFGQKFGSAFTDVLITDCLDRTKPMNDKEYANYEMVIDKIVEFQSQLVEFNVFESDNRIVQYAKHMDEVVIEHKCNQYLASAISLMKKDLHDSVEIGVDCEDGNLLAPEQFPRSVVSRSVIDILELVRALLDEASDVSEKCAASLICTAQSIFYQYGNIVHGHHERLLLTIPQQVALFRNNCLYIAHNLDQINTEYSFSTVVLPSPPLFTDQRHQLQTIGGEIFLGYIDEQVRLMEMVLEETLTAETIANKLTPDLEKLIRQCLRQYELLRTVWVKILPLSVYNKSMGYLFNSFCKKLIAAVVNAQDIPSKNAEQLVETLKVVQTRGPKIFSNSQEVGLYVEKWGKLNDLVFILGANLAGISDMWSDGKGTLTLTFPVEEVRSLIKALFQNTDRRAAILNRIH